MIKDLSGSMPKVVGSRIEMVATGPKPGITPTRVPIRTPIKQKKRFMGSSAREKAKMKLARKSTVKIPKYPSAAEFSTRDQTTHRKTA